MKRFLRPFCIFIAILFCITLAACDLDTSDRVETGSVTDTSELSDTPQKIYPFFAEVLEVYSGSILVLPDKGSSERQSSGDAGIYVSTVVSGESIAPDGLEKGSYIRVFYNGLIAESYPAQIFTVYEIELIADSMPINSDSDIDRSSGIIVSSGNISIFAESFFLDSLDYTPTDDPEVFTVSQGCGAGAWFVLTDPEHVFPTIKKNGDVDILITTEAILKGIYIATPNGEDIESTYITEDELNTLQSGEYLIVLKVTFYRNSYGSKQSYTSYEDVFKLIVE